MSDTLQRIAFLSEERRQLHEEGLRRWLTEAERDRLHQLDGDIREAWDLRRLEQAQQPQIDHELVIVRELGR